MLYETSEQPFNGAEKDRHGATDIQARVDTRGRPSKEETKKSPHLLGHFQEDALTYKTFYGMY